MKLESPSFTPQDIASFFTDYLEHEREHLIARLEALVERTDGLISAIPTSQGSEAQWSGPETLAHMVSSAQYFGYLAHLATSGKDPGDVLQAIKMRDVITVELAKSEPEVLAQQLRESVERVIGFLRKTEPTSLRVPFDFAGMGITVEDLLRVALCAHLESHVQQIESSLQEIGLGR